MKKLLILAFLAALTYSCEETDLPLLTNFDPASLNDSWDWVKSNHPDTDQEIMPVNDLTIASNVVILEHRLIFEDGRLTVRVDNDSPDWLAIRQSAFELEENPDDPDHPFVAVSSNAMETIPSIGGVYQFGDYFRVEEVSADRLVLAQAGNCNECWVHTFRKTE